MSFKRSPSKVWWGSETLEFREVSSSPGSQDSGFSDTEGSPRNSKKDNLPEVNNNHDTPKGIAPTSRTQIAKNIYKDTSNAFTNENLSCNYKEKSTPVKQNIEQRLVKTERRGSPHFLKKFESLTEPAKRQRYVKHSPKVSRNLFTSKYTKECAPNQYSKLTLKTTEEPNEEDEENSHDYSTSSEISGTKSLPLTKNSPRAAPRLGLSAPDVLQTSIASKHELNSSSESELEHIFEDLDGEHTSTPKCLDLEMRHRRRNRGRLQHRYREIPRVPPIPTDGTNINNSAVLRWLEEARESLEQECTTTLQCKSIAAELAQKVSHLAACSTTILRGLLSHCRCIEMDYKHLNSETNQRQFLIQSLAGSIMDFLRIHCSEVNSKSLKLYDRIKDAKAAEARNPLTELFNEWQVLQNQVLVDEIKKLVGKLEDPISDLDLRATLTGITSVSLRNVDLIAYFVKAEIIPILLILCERCEGSSLRTLILRALSTMCTNASAIRSFEKFSGIQIISDTLEEESKPEPERSEAVGLLAQVTAPWIDDNHSINSLQEYSKRLISSLTKFSASTKCCQNLLLCAAALANLSSLDNKCIKLLVESGSAPILLASIKSRGPFVSVYLLEQVATLMANMAVLDIARKQLILCEAPNALIHFLRSPKRLQHEDAERRLLQKSVIALSRLCSVTEASRQVVDCGGLRRLVELCREKHKRFSSDAVLVAALATLRKIVEACGKDVLDVQDCQELVEPKLLDSFLAYSTQNESYV
ncbi:protein inscuteable homolog isoform X1 [Euwallacea fornicatus]|uniref:protein inscuteable homolog isoform X1 n=1 Tax=Euwallacea fornicatus TaxID=995702 RepID=UPI00338FD096